MREIDIFFMFLGIGCFLLAGILFLTREAFKEYPHLTAKEDLKKTYHFLVWKIAKLAHFLWHNLICNPNLGLSESRRARICDRFGDVYHYHEWAYAGFPDEYEYEDGGFSFTVDVPEDQEEK